MPLSTASTALTPASGFTSQPAQPSSPESVVAPPPPAHMPFRPSAMLAAAALAAAQQPAAPSTTPVASSDALHAAEVALGAGATENGAEEGGAVRPRLKLLPRSLPLEPHVPGPLDRAGSTESLPAATGSTAVTHPAGPATQTLTTRPRLQLQPRSQRPGSAEGDAPGAGPMHRATCLLALPELDPGEELGPLLDGLDPFFSGSAVALGARALPAPRAFSNYSDQSALHGMHGSRQPRASFGSDDEAGPVAIKRSLPVRVTDGLL
ncbi:hypothetical protein HaLaN_04883 [Haematococcus lacustris]|uniref:Uncharacterized protein n=1 Tax=Haematococcus lacustris TaxID=44745 RepID=A0A699YHX9_HAELA|nr:hypothetical protein HaLaN_04883 [Haematococcus lacustris]